MEIINDTQREKLLRFLEFFVVGLGFGVIEDLIAIKAASGITISWDTIWIALIVALPFAVFSELIVDHPKFWNFGRKKKRNGAS